MALSPGALVDGKYRVLRLIGEGGMGSVWEGENVRIGRRVAIKVMHAEVSANKEFAQRFEREARAAARIGSAHICDVLDLGDLPGGHFYMVMEFLDGESLGERMRARGQLGVSETVRIAHQLLEGLGRLHAVGVVHRDLKPANIFLARTARGESVKILDFGVSKFESLSDEAHQLTTTGAIMGTPQYMSPEQARGKNRQVDARSDLYSAGVIMYRCLSGRPPFEGENFQELLFKIALEEPTALEQLAPEVDPGLAAIVRKAMARDPADRFQVATEFQESLSGWGRLQDRPSLAFDETLASHDVSQLPNLRTTSPSHGSNLPSAQGSVGPRTPAERASAAATGKTTPTAWSETNNVRPGTATSPASVSIALPREFGNPPTGRSMASLGAIEEAPPSGPRRRGLMLGLAVVGAAAATSIGVLLARAPLGDEAHAPPPPVTATGASAAPPPAESHDVMRNPAPLADPSPAVLPVAPAETTPESPEPRPARHAEHAFTARGERAAAPPPAPAPAPPTSTSATSQVGTPPTPPATLPPAAPEPPRTGRKIRTEL